MSDTDTETEVERQHSPVEDLLSEQDESAGIDLEKVAEAASSTFYQSIQNAANSTDRSKQAQEFFLGVSNLGHCRQYAALATKQTEPSDERDKTAAFLGTVAGEAIEAQIQVDHPEWITQAELEFDLPSGGTIPGHADIVIPSWAEDPENNIFQGVWDGKSKAELETIRKYGPTQQQIYQIHAYAAAAIKKGLLDPNKPIVVADVYFDRSGKDVVPYAVPHIYREDVVHFIDEWVNDVKYAVVNGEDASRDMPREWCWNWCEYATACRGHDTDTTGLIEDPEFLAAVALNREASAMETKAKKMKAAAKIAIAGRSGSTGEFNVRQVYIEPTVVAEQHRAGYTKLDIRPIPGAKKKAPSKEEK